MSRRPPLYPSLKGGGERKIGSERGGGGGEVGGGGERKVGSERGGVGVEVVGKVKGRLEVNGEGLEVKWVWDWKEGWK